MVNPFLGISDTNFDTKFIDKDKYRQIMTR